MDDSIVSEMTEPTAETSKAGLRRMRRLALESPTLGSSLRASIHPTTSQLIYPSPASSRIQGLLASSLFSSSHPTVVSTPPVLTPGRHISHSPSGEWTIIFHSNPSDNGSTLAIYPSSISSPLSTSSNVIPLATFSLPSPPISVAHLYPPRIQLTTSRTPPCGPRPPPNHDISHGPTFVVLLESGIWYFYAVPVQNGQVTSWNMTFLRAPLRSRFHAIAGSDGPSEDGFKVKRGWSGLIPGNEGIWIGWEGLDELGVTRVEIGNDKHGRYYMQTIPMPTVPRVDKIPFADSAAGIIKEELQGIFFTALIDKEKVKQETNEVIQVDGDIHTSSSVERVGAVLVYNDSAFHSSYSFSTSRSRIVVHSFERREIELAQGFNDITSGSGDITPSFDWSTVPEPIHHLTSPPNTSIVALQPIPAVPPHSLALALISQPVGLSLAHLNLVTDQWTLLGDTVDLGELKGGTGADLEISQGASRGQLGLAALIGKEGAPTLLVVNRIEGLPSLGGMNDASAVASQAAMSIVLAERQGVDWSDVIRAVVGSTGVGRYQALISEIAKTTYTLALKETHIDELNLLLKTQIGLFSATDDARLELTTDILRLKEAGHLIDRCAIFTEDKTISFDLDSIWPLMNVMEWSIDLVSKAMRDTVLLGGQMEWLSVDQIDFNQPSSIILLAHPYLRKIVLRILSQLNQLVSFLHSLERPILQPETKNVPAPIRRDAMATVLAKDRVRDVAYREGIDVLDWGKSLESISPRDISEDSINESLIKLSLEPLRSNLIDIIESLPFSSSLFLSSTQSDLSPQLSYDAITYSPLTTSSTSRNGTNIVCGRCGNATEELGNLFNVPMLGELSPWNKWKSNYKHNCVCGGTWIKGSVSKA
ncbi:uncharacterized protein IL334_006096 [Kwoniella shivajii]|uniref:Mediator complex subunit 16 C-terminal domain-containing protein n=1 Tax=Kwoniella shivajii TaxID=564305 RepID=A0ABZ1D4Z4_9TREE|nr:hypothetical protein IL334_006096 [Kwoniella shivajii]